MADGQPTVAFSIVSTSYCEEGNVQAFYERLRAVLADRTELFEIIFVDDGSVDNTFAQLKAIAAQDPRVRVMKLAYNHGQWRAMTAGVAHARAPRIVLFDCDLEIAPEALPAFLDPELADTEIISAHREERKGSRVRVLISAFGNKLLRSLLGLQLTDLGAGLKVIHRDLFERLGIGTEKAINPLLVFVNSRSVVNLQVHYYPRETGKSGWSPLTVAARFGRSFLDLWVDQIPARIRARLVLMGLGALALVGAVLHSLGAGLTWSVVATGVIAAGLAVAALAVRPARRGSAVGREPCFELNGDVFEPAATEPSPARTAERGNRL